MGFPTDLVDSDEGHTSEFICSICQLLVEYPLLTSCTHVFCESCLREWFRRKRSCPKCQANLNDADQVCGLKEGSPIAHRILLRIRVRCPLGGQGCRWTGDYSEVQNHLTNSSEHLGTEEANNSDLKHASDTNNRTAGANASALKDQGNAKFELKQYRDAIELYTKAISVGGDTGDLVASCYNNRAAALFMLKQFRACVESCERAIVLNPQYVKAHIRRGKALVELGEFARAADLLLHTEIARSSDEMKLEHERIVGLTNTLNMGRKACEQGEYNRARTLIGGLLRQTNAVVVVLWAARAELGLGLCDRALRLTLQVLRVDKSHAEAYTVRAKAVFLSGDINGAGPLLRESLRLDPDASETKALFKMTRAVKGLMDEALGHFNVRRFEEATTLYTQVLTLARPPPKAQLYTQVLAARATSWLRLKKYPECLKDAAEAIYAHDDSRDAWLARVQALHSLGRHDESLEDLTSLMQRWGSNDPMIRHAYERADFEVRKAKRPKYYEAMGVMSVASESEIKSAYRRRALECHPDKMVDKEPEERKKAEAEFKFLGDVLEVLTDPFKRQLYDEGYDKEAIESRVAAAQRAAHENPDRRGHHHHHH